MADPAHDLPTSERLGQGSEDLAFAGSKFEPLWHPAAVCEKLQKGLVACKIVVMDDFLFAVRTCRGPIS